MKNKIFRIALLAPIVLSVVYLIIYFINGDIGAVSSTAWYCGIGHDPGFAFDHQLPFPVSRWWDIASSYVYLLLLLYSFQKTEETKEKLWHVYCIIFLLISLFLSFGFNFVLGAAFGAIIFTFFPAEEKPSGIVAILFTSFIVIFLEIMGKHFIPGLTVGLLEGLILTCAIVVFSAIAKFCWRIGSFLFTGIYNWMFK